MARLVADLVFESVVRESTFASCTVGDEVKDILCRRESTAFTPKVMGNMIFRVEVGC